MIIPIFRMTQFYPSRFNHTRRLNGVTGRMGANQHLGRSIAAIRKQGGIQLSDQSSLPQQTLHRPQYGGS